MRTAILLLNTIVTSFLFASDWSEGQSFGGSTLNYYKSNMGGAINNPLTTDQQMTTVDGSKSGSGTILCSEGATKEYLEVGYVGSGDITVTVQMDKDLDGVKESSWSFNGISGVCSNGAIKCNSGTWNNCLYYEWSYNGGIVELNEASPDQLGGCYCINNSCGNLALTQKSNVLNDLAGGISPLLTNNSSYVITRTENTGDSVKYWGQDYSNCSSGDMPSVNDSNIQSQSTNEAASQLNDPNSAYYILNEGSQNTDSGLDDSYKTDLTNRSTSTRTSVTNQPGTNDYSYTDNINGSTINVSGSLVLGTTPNAKYCEVQWNENSTDAFVDGTNRENSTTNNNTIKTEIRECTNDWTVCPVNSGESIKYNCGAIDSFAEVTSALNAVSEATKDMVCSTK